MDIKAVVRVGNACAPRVSVLKRDVWQFPESGREIIDPEQKATILLDLRKPQAAK